MGINPFKKSDQKTDKPVAPVEKPSTAKADVKPNPETPVVTKSAIIDLNKPIVKEAVEQGRMLLKGGKSKADAARLIFSLLKDEDKNLIVAAFIDGASLTPKGALTYWYNCKRKQEKLT